jgi:hypothetical protein
MKIELSDEKITRMAEAIHALANLAAYKGRKFDDIPIRLCGNHYELGSLAHPSKWPTLKPIFAKHAEQLELVCELAIDEVREELRRIANGENEQ